VRGRNRRRHVRAQLTMRVALEPGTGRPWLYARDNEVPVELAAHPRTLERARRKLPQAARRPLNLSTGGLGVTVPTGSDVMPHDHIMALLALGPDKRPLDTVAGIPSRVVRARETLNGLEVGLAFEVTEPAVDRRLAALIQARERRRK